MRLVQQDDCEAPLPRANPDRNHGYSNLTQIDINSLMAYWLTIELEHGRLAPLPKAMDIAGEALAYGTTVPHLLARLGEIARQLGLPPLDRFIYKDPTGFAKIQAEAEAEANAVLASAMRAEISLIAERPRWHEPAAARQTISSLKEFLATNPHLVASPDPEVTAQWTLWDLEAYERILAEIEAQGIKFAFVEHN